MLFFLIFLIIPLIEVGLFAAVGDEVGMINTLLLCVVTAMIGSYLVRQQGLETLMSARQRMEHNDLPVKELFDGVCLAISGFLLITPGFFTDTIGFSLLIPFIRDILRVYAMKHIQLNTMGFGETHEHQRPPAGDDVIDADYEEVDEDKKASGQ